MALKKITAIVDKDMTAVNKVRETREAAQAFRTRYTPGDLLRAFFETPRGFIADEDDIVECTVDVFPSVCDGYHYHVSMLIEGCVTVHRLTFFVDDSEYLKVNNDPLLITVKTFRLER